MGKGYSLNGYLNAALRRTSKTFLVEGASDKSILHKMELERYPEKSDHAIIDHAGLINDPLVEGFGNKRKVIAIQELADTLSIQNPKISELLATLIDREWDNLSFSEMIPDLPWTPPLNSSNRFVTTGHSIENYSFNQEFAIEFVKYIAPEYVSSVFISKIRESFEHIIILAGATSLTARNYSCLGKFSGIFHFDHIDIKNEAFYLSPAFSSACIDRNITSYPTMADEINKYIDNVWSQLSDKSCLQWIPHGHIGEDIVWCSIGKIASRCGIPPAIVEEISRGHRKERTRFKAQWLSKVDSNHCTPLDKAIEWIHN